MSKLPLFLFLLCLSIAACSAGVLPRIPDKRQNDISNLGASESEFFELTKIDDNMLEEDDPVKNPVKSKLMNSSKDESEFAITKIDGVLNSTTVAFGDSENSSSKDGNNGNTDDAMQSDAGRINPIEESNDVLSSKTSELKENIKVPGSNITSLETVVNSTSSEIMNRSMETIRSTNETNDNTTVLSSVTNNTQFSLFTKDMEMNMEEPDNETMVSEILQANFSILPNETTEFGDFDDTKNSSSIRGFEIFSNETVSMGVGNFSSNTSEVLNEIELFKNITVNSGQRFTNFNESDITSEYNSSLVVFLNETEMEQNKNLTDEWRKEQNSSFVVLSNETESLNENSFENTPDMNVGNLKSLNSPNKTEREDNIEDYVEESDSFTLRENETSDAMSKNENSKLESETEDISKDGLTSLTSETESGSIFSNFGLDFLKNTQIAKNAAKAMEIFNLSDSITDHIIEENEFHSFLDATPASVDSVNANALVKPSLEQFDPSTIFNINGSPEGLKTSEETETNVSETDTPLINQISDIEGVTLLNDTMLSDSVNTMSNLTDNGAISSDDVNEHVNASGILNDTLSQVTSSISEVKGNATSSSLKCPPPGVCIFWFLAQDTCALNSHCLGSRICCKIRCSKTCIEV